MRKQLTAMTCSLVWLGVLAIAPLERAIAQSGANADGKADLSEMDLESLMNLEVTSVSRQEESLRDATAAIYVITAEDIERSPATSLPELLRQVPGLQVSQTDGNSWAVTARGFNSGFANKLLVMIDGRSIYTPIFSGVFWDSKDVLLEDIERIEVIRGSGAVMWGANAVNGVISIITKSASATKGGLVTAMGGDEQRGTIGVRYGTELGEKGAIRLYGKYRNVDGNQLASDGSQGYDGLEDGRGGFRYDYSGAVDQVLVSGEMMRGSRQSTNTMFSVIPPESRDESRRGNYQGAHLLARWGRSLTGGDSLSSQFFVDREDRDDLVIKSEVTILDYELNYQFGLGESHNFIAGSNYRWTTDRLDGTDSASFDPEDRQMTRASLFLQDEIELVDSTFFVTLGGKLEYHDFSGFEPQPHVMARWRINSDHTLWASSSYSARIPSRAENDVFTVQSIVQADKATSVIAVEGNTETDSEHVTTVELGYRASPTSNWSFDLVTYYNSYRDISSVELGDPALAGFDGERPVLLVPLEFKNNGKATAYGVELATNLSFSKQVTAQLGGNFMDIDYDYGSGAEGGGGGLQGSDPRHQAHLRLTYQPLESVDVIAQTRYVDSLRALGIDSYVEGDLRIAYRPCSAVELSLNGTNLFNPAHREYNTQAIKSPDVAIQRSVWAGLRVHF